MGTIAVLIIGVVIGLAVFLVLLQKGHLGGLTNHVVQTSEVTDSVVNIRINGRQYSNITPDESEYDQYCKLIDGLKYTKDYETEKKKLRIGLENKVNELKSIRDKKKQIADNDKTNTISSSERDYENNQRIRNTTRSNADALWQSQTSERERERTKARSEYDKRCAEIDRLHETRRNELYKAKSDADNVYTKAQELHSRNKSNAYNICSNDKNKADTEYSNNKSIIDSEYAPLFKALNEELKKEINEQLTPDQKEKYKKYL